MKGFERLLFINALGEEVELHNGQIVMLTSEGLTGLEAEFITTQFPEQIGASVRKLNVSPRLLTIYFNLISASASEEQYMRGELQRAINPLYGKGTLVYGNQRDVRQTGAFVKIAPEFDDSNPLRPIGILSFSITFFLDEALWEDRDETKIDLVELLPLFEFELEIPKEGVELSSLTDGEIHVVNDGAAPTPLYFTFYGPAINPNITLNGNEFIRIRDELFADEKMYISTKGGDKKVEIYRSDGSIQNAYNRIDYRSKFFQLPVGDSFISFDADVGSDEASIEICFRKKYSGV